MPTLTNSLLDYWPGRKRKRTTQERRAEKERKKRLLTGAAEDWLNHDFFLKGQAHNIIGIPDERCFTLQSVVRSLGSVAGDVAECGVRFGKSSVFMLEADLSARHYHLFDSFEGLSKPAPEDLLTQNGESYWIEGDIETPEAGARAHLSGFRNVTLYKGWIPARFPEVADRRFALVHVDVDLFEPTRESLDFFWPKLVENGILVCDDYGSRRCPGAKKAMDAFFADKDVSLLELTTGQAVVVRRPSPYVQALQSRAVR